MISWIIFMVGVVLSIGLGYVVNLSILAFWQVLVIFIVALVVLIALNAVCAIISAKVLPDKVYNSQNKFFIPGKAEIKFYNRLSIKKWKDKTAEWGKLNGFSKKNIENPKDPQYIKKFILECNKGYLGHFSSIIVSTLVLICVPKCLILPMALPMFITAFLLNYIPIMILRYNVSRLNSLLRFAERNNKR